MYKLLYIIVDLKKRKKRSIPNTFIGIYILVYHGTYTCWVLSCKFRTWRVLQRFSSLPFSFLLKIFLSRPQRLILLLRVKDSSLYLLRVFSDSYSCTIFRFKTTFNVIIKRLVFTFLQVCFIQKWIVYQWFYFWYSLSTYLCYLYRYFSFYAQLLVLVSINKLLWFTCINIRDKKYLVHSFLCKNTYVYLYVIVMSFYYFLSFFF